MAVTRWLELRPWTALFIATFYFGLTTQLAAQPTDFRDNQPLKHRGTNPFDVIHNSVSSSNVCLRRPLTDHSGAVSVEPVYYGEVFSNTRGGITTSDAIQYQALLDIAVTCDFEETKLPIPGKFFLLAQNTHGRGLTEDFVGDTQVLSNIDSFDNVMQVSEYWWEFGLLDDDVTFRLGKQDFNTEFLFIDVAEDFIQSSFGLSPSAALPTYPAPSIAALVLMQLDETLVLKLGVWDPLAPIGSWGFSGNDSVLVAAELEYKYALDDGKYPGILSLGAGFLSGDQVLGEPFGDVHGYAAQFEQLIWRECMCDADPIQGLSIFAGYYPRFSDRPVLNEAIGDSFVAGLVYTGLVPHRNEDVVGAGIAWAETFQGGTNEETVVELYYKARILPHISLQPDLQYIATPSGIHRDALVVGVRLQTTF